MDNKHRKTLKANRALQAKTIIKLTHRTFHNIPFNIRGKQESLAQFILSLLLLWNPNKFSYYGTFAISVRHRISRC